MAEVQHWRVTYNDIHNLIRHATSEVAQDFNPDLMIAIGMGPCGSCRPRYSLSRVFQVAGLF